MTEGLNPYPPGGWDIFPNRLLDPDWKDNDEDTREEDTYEEDKQLIGENDE